MSTSAGPAGRPERPDVTIGAGFEAVFLDPLGQVVQQRWQDAAWAVAFEDLQPVSAFPVVPGRRWGPGLWWSATTGRHVSAGSSVMRAQLTVLDRDPRVVGLAGRPVRLLWRESRGRVRTWTPQLFARYTDGTGLLADCPGHMEAGGQRALDAATAMQEACADVGWTYRRLLPLDPVRAANLKWLAGYRHPRNQGRPKLMNAVLAAFTARRPLIEGVHDVGDPIEVLPVAPRPVAPVPGGSPGRAAARTRTGRPRNAARCRPAHGTPARRSPGRYRRSRQGRRRDTRRRRQRHARAIGSGPWRLGGTRRGARASRAPARGDAVSGTRQGRRPVVAAGAHVRFRGSRWQVVALAGQSFHLAGEDGGDEVVLAGHLFADPSFAVLGADVQPAQAAPQWGLFETAPAPARQKALAWQRHIREVECGLPEGPGTVGAVRESYDPDRWTLAQREQAKAAELTAMGFGKVSRTTVQRMRLAYRKQGLWGLVDHRATRTPTPTGRADERVVTAVKDVLRSRRGRSKGTISALMPLVAQVLKDRHGDAVPMPAQATFYRLVHQLASPADHPARRISAPPITEDGRGFTPTVALRPGEQVQIDTTRLDVLALFDDGGVGRPELTIAVDVATRAILAAVLTPATAQAVDAALLLAEMAVPHPARPTWPDALHFAHTRLLPHQRVFTLDERLAGAAARPVVIPETVVVDRGKIYLSGAFTAACETLGISVQPAPPHAPTAKGIVERTFGSINSLFCQHLPGYTGSDVTRRGKDVERDACYTVPQLQDLLDEWLVHYHHRPHQGLRHPVLPRAVLTPNQMWAALLCVTGHVPVPLTGTDYLELLPVRWQAITERGIRLHHRTYDHDLLAPYRGQASPIAARGGKWEVHTNPHDLRQIWIRLPDGELTEIPWIHRDHTHHPFNERTWNHIRTTVAHQHADPDTHEAELADALDQLMRRARAGHATRTEQHLLARTAPPRTPPPPHTGRTGHREGDQQEPDISTTAAEDDSLDALDDTPDEDTINDDNPTSPALHSGYGLYDAAAEALKW